MDFIFRKQLIVQIVQSEKILHKFAKWKQLILQIVQCENN